MAWECLEDPLILAALSGGGSAALAIAARLSRSRASLSWRPMCGGALTNYFVGGSISLVLLHVIPGKPALVLALTILATYLWDWTADDTRSQWRSVAMERTRRIIDAALNGDRKP